MPVLTAVLGGFHVARYCEWKILGMLDDVRLPCRQPGAPQSCNDSRKLSKIKRERKKKGIVDKSKLVVRVPQKSNKVLPHSGQEQYQTSITLRGNVNDEVEQNTVAHSTVKSNATQGGEEDGGGQWKGQRKRLKRKKYKEKNNENPYLQLSSSSVPSVRKTLVTNQLQPQADTSQRARTTFPPQECSRNMSKHALKQKNRPFQNNAAVCHADDGTKSLKANRFNPLKRKMHAFSPEAENDEIPVKKQMTAKQDICNPIKSIKQRKFKNKSKASEIESFRDRGTAPSEAFQNAKVKLCSQKNSSGRVNTAFSGDSSILDDSGGSGRPVPRQLTGKIFPENNIYNGIVNEAFSDESGLQDVARSGGCQTRKQTIAQRYLKKQTWKGTVNPAFVTESRTPDESCNRNQQMPQRWRKTGQAQRERKLEGVVNEAFGSEPSSPGDSASAGDKLREQVKPSPCNIPGSAPSGLHLTRKARSSLSLRDRMIAKLKASRFRYLNEQIYSSESSDIQQYFSNDKNSFMAYHEGFKQQISQWPLNPLDRIISALKKKPETLVIADFGCGDARLAHSLPNVVHSFDVVGLSDKVTVCDMSRTPLGTGSVDVVVFCLSLMGTNLADYLLEAHRVLRVGGQLKIAEVESRFEDVNNFVHSLKKFGFTNTLKDLSHNMFYFLDFKKDDKKIKRNCLPPLTLKPCLYKKR